MASNLACSRRFFRLKRVGEMISKLNKLKMSGAVSLAKGFSLVDGLLESGGLTLVESSDFKELRKLCRKQLKRKVSPHFRLSKFELTKENSFWQSYVDENDELLSLQCFRLDRLGEMTLDEYLPGQHQRIYKKPNKVGENNAPIMKDITGNVVYTGDFWICEKLRGGEIPKLISLSGFFNCQMNLDPNWIYGFTDTSLAEKGFPFRSGFDLAQDAGLDWLVEPPGINGDDCIIAVSRSWVTHKAFVIAKRVRSENRKKQKT